MTPFEVYCEYICLRNHFSADSYDYFRYKGKSRLKPSSFQNRKDKIFFEKLSKHSDVHGFLVANLSINEKAWIRELAYSDEAERIYKLWLRHQQSLTYSFKNDLSKLESQFNLNFICEDNQHPILLQKYLGGDINLETLCILLDITGAKKYWDLKMAYDLVYDMLKLKITKYTPFINYEKEKYKKICLDYFTK